MFLLNAGRTICIASHHGFMELQVMPFFFFVSLYFQSTHLNPLLEEQLLFQSVYVIPVALGFKMPPMYMGIKTQGIIIISVVCY